MKRSNEILVSLITLIRKEIKRYLRIWVQTLVPPAVTMSLYFVIFSISFVSFVGSELYRCNFLILIFGQDYFH